MKRKIQLEVSEDDDQLAYLRLPDHPGRCVPGVVKRQIRLRDVLEYAGPDIYFDFDDDGKLLGAEILA
jgi:hypothetical protein